MVKTYLYSENNLDNLAKSIFFSFGKYKKWALKGQMGAGKTTLIKSVVKQLQSSDIGASPTFTLVNQYESPAYGDLYHIDLYRLNTLQDVFNAGILDIIESDQYCFIEWPELIEDYINESWLKIDIETVAEGVRRMKVSYELKG